MVLGEEASCYYFWPQPNLSLYLLYYNKAWSKFALLRVIESQGNIATCVDVEPVANRL